jgi:hypothetical protein
MLSMAIRKKRKCTVITHANQLKPSTAIKKARQESAFVQLTELRKHNTGNTLNHDISLIVSAHNDTYVTRSSLNYMLRKRIEAATVPAYVERMVPEVHNDNEEKNTRFVNMAVPLLEVNFDETINSISDISKERTGSAKQYSFIAGEGE